MLDQGFVGGGNPKELDRKKAMRVMPFRTIKRVALGRMKRFGERLLRRAVDTSTYREEE